jgi:hypothetical protein
MIVSDRCRTQIPVLKSKYINTAILYQTKLILEILMRDIAGESNGK